MHLQPTILGAILKHCEDNPVCAFVFPSLTGPDRDKENMDTLEPEL